LNWFTVGKVITKIKGWTFKRSPFYFCYGNQI